MMSGPMPTIAVVNHGNAGFKWMILDWGILVAEGYERTKTAALEKAREVSKQIFNQQPQTR